jgi:hypothetical protein
MFAPLKANAKLHLIAFVSLPVTRSPVARSMTAFSPAGFGENL